jgi:hypothetical protein
MLPLDAVVQPRDGRSCSARDLRRESDLHYQLGKPTDRGPARAPPASARRSPGPLGAAQESESNSGYFAARNATWTMKATPAIGWNE